MMDDFSYSKGLAFAYYLSISVVYFCLLSRLKVHGSVKMCLSYNRPVALCYIRHLESDFAVDHINVVFSYLLYETPFGLDET